MTVIEKLVEAAKELMATAPAITSSRIVAIADAVAAYESEQAERMLPIDEEWLVKLSDYQDIEGIHFREPESGKQLSCDFRLEDWDYMGRYVVAPKTRGEVWDLLEALRIKERA